MRLLRRSQVLLLWGAQTLSVFGDRLYAMAVMWIAWEKTGAGAMGLVAIAESVPYIVLGTVGRPVVDRFASLRGVGRLDVARALLVAGLPWVWTAFGTPGLLASVAALGVCGALFDPNLGALVPDLVEPEQVQAVNGLMDLTGRIARVAGPGSAGVLLAVMPMAGLFWLDAVTFAFSGLALEVLSRRWRMTSQETPPVPRTPAVETAQVGRGARALLRSDPGIATVLAVHSCGIFAGAVSLAMPALLATRLHAGAGTYGTVLAVAGVGSLVGNTVAGNLRLTASLPALYCGTWVLSGLLLALTGAVVSLPMLLLVSAASGVLSPFLSVTLMTHFSTFPSPARRRLLTVDQMLIRTAGTLSMLLVPGFAAADPVVGFVAGGTGTVVVAGIAFAAMLWHSRSRTPLTLAAGKTSGDPVLSRAVTR